MNPLNEHSTESSKNVSLMKPKTKIAMKKLLHLLIGPFSIIPLAYVVILAINLLNYPDLLIELESMFNWLIWVVLILISIISYYVVFIFNTSLIPTGRKTLWTILLFFGHVVILPIFWFMFLLADEPKENDEKTL